MRREEVEGGEEGWRRVGEVGGGTKEEGGMEGGGQTLRLFYQ